MSVVSEIIESFIEEGKRFLKLLKFGSDDNINTFQVGNFGEDSNVPAGYVAIYLKTSNSEEPVCIGVINNIIISDLNPGDKQIFSTNEAGDAVAAFLKLLNTGDIEINSGSAFVKVLADGTQEFNGNADFIAGFNELKAGFDELKSDFNTFVNSVYNSHVHPGVSSGGASTGPTPASGSPSSASIDDSKKDNLKTE